MHRIIPDYISEFQLGNLNWEWYNFPTFQYMAMQTEYAEATAFQQIPRRTLFMKICGNMLMHAIESTYHLEDGIAPIEGLEHLTNLAALVTKDPSIKLIFVANHPSFADHILLPMVHLYFERELRKLNPSTHRSFFYPATHDGTELFINPSLTLMYNIGAILVGFSRFRIIQNYKVARKEDMERQPILNLIDKLHTWEDSTIIKRTLFKLLGTVLTSTLRYSQYRAMKIMNANTPLYTPKEKTKNHDQYFFYLNQNRHEDLLIHPDGRVSSDSIMGDGEIGAALTASKDRNSIIVPVTFNPFQEFKKKRFKPRTRNFGLPIKIVIGEPINVKDALENVRTDKVLYLHNKVMHAIASNREEMYRGPWIDPYYKAVKVKDTNSSVSSQSILSHPATIRVLDWLRILKSMHR